MCAGSSNPVYGDEKIKEPWSSLAPRFMVIVDLAD
jgi:hypothetical protein